MAHITVEWWKATEIPLGEKDWRNIKLYCNESDEIWHWTNCAYFIRLSPPYQIAYKNDVTPLIYIGRGAIKQRWASHRVWLQLLARYLPGARYEVWVCNHERFKDIEADALSMFDKHFGQLPLANFRFEARQKPHEYDSEFFSVTEDDRRYWWAIRPTQTDLQNYYESGGGGVLSANE